MGAIHFIMPIILPGCMKIRIKLDERDERLDERDEKVDDRPLPKFTISDRSLNQYPGIDSRTDFAAGLCPQNDS
jgi:hypothetical protein